MEDRHQLVQKMYFKQVEAKIISDADFLILEKDWPNCLWMYCQLFPAATDKIKDQKLKDLMQREDKKLLLLYLYTFENVGAEDLKYFTDFFNIKTLFDEPDVLFKYSYKKVLAAYDEGFVAFDTDTPYIENGNEGQQLTIRYIKDYNNVLNIDFNNLNAEIFSGEGKKLQEYQSAIDQCSADKLGEKVRWVVSTLNMKDKDFRSYVRRLNHKNTVLQNVVLQIGLTLTNDPFYLSPEWGACFSSKMTPEEAKNKGGALLQQYERIQKAEITFKNKRHHRESMARVLIGDFRLEDFKKQFPSATAEEICSVFAEFYLSVDKNVSKGINGLLIAGLEGVYDYLHQLIIGPYKYFFYNCDTAAYNINADAKESLKAPWVDLLNEHLYQKFYRLLYLLEVFTVIWIIFFMADWMLMLPTMVLIASLFTDILLCYESFEVHKKDFISVRDFEAELNKNQMGNRALLKDFPDLNTVKKDAVM